VNISTVVNTGTMTFYILLILLVILVKFFSLMAISINLKVNEKH